MINNMLVSSLPMAPVIDTHAHFWQWPAGAAGERARHEAAKAPAAYAHPPETYDELLAVLAAAGVEHVLQVTRTAMGHDNGYSLEGAAAHPERIKVFGRFDATAPDVASRLAAEMDQPGMAGVRLHAFPPDDRALAGAGYDPFWTAAAALGVPVAVYVPNGASVIGAVARAHPDVLVLVDHVAADVMPQTDPALRLHGWDDLLALAPLTNVVVKVSALPEACDEGPPFTRSRALLRELLDGFGAERLLWGSNYPPVLRVCSYAEAVDLVRGWDAIDDTTRDLMLGGNARRLLDLGW